MVQKEIQRKVKLNLDIYNKLYNNVIFLNFVLDSPEHYFLHYLTHADS